MTDYFSIDRNKREYSCSSNDDTFEPYVPEKDPKNKKKYVPPKSKKATNYYSGDRRMVKFKEITEYNKEEFGSLRKEKKPAPRKIICVTEIMVDISDTETEGEYYDTTSQEKVTK